MAGQDKQIQGTSHVDLVSSEVAGGFTGVTIGLFAEGNGDGAYADFTYFDYEEQ